MIFNSAVEEERDINVTYSHANYRLSTTREEKVFFLSLTNQNLNKKRGETTLTDNLSS